jgi:GT2 family glycosyltransferase
VARNVGAKVAKGKYLILLDDDSFFPSAFALKKIWQKLKTLPKDVKILSLNVVTDSKKWLSKEDRLDFTFIGAGAVIEKDILRMIPFDEDFFVYGEEDDLSYRILLSGYKILYTPNIRIKHVTSSGKNGKSLFYLTRNWVWIFLKYYPFPIAIIASLVNVVCIFTKSLKKRISSLPVLLGAASAILHFRKILVKRQPLNKITIDLLLRITPKNSVFKIGLLKILKIFIH